MKIKQVIYQVYYRLNKPRLRRVKCPDLRGGFKKMVGGGFQKPATKDGKVFTFLGRTVRLESCWDDARYPKLWLYNLHYQDDLNASGAEEQLDLCSDMVDSWIENNPPFIGNGWEPYCLSLRIVNWVKFFSRIEKSEIKRSWLQSLAIQADGLNQQLEFHILANHLFANAKALVFVGSFFGGKQGELLLMKGLKLLDQELNEQFLSDGAHYERSPMYQGTLLWDLLDLIRLSKSVEISVLSVRVEYWEKLLVKGMQWLSNMSHPDGKISFFNDATFGVAPDIKALQQYATYNDIPITSRVDSPSRLLGTILESSGYGIIYWPLGHKLIADLAPVGPDYQPGHAHADTLSCELSLFGERVLVNSGISQYGNDLERQRQRSSAAHNCVVVNGESSSEVWSGFRVARRAKPFNIKLSREAKRVELSGSHDGYMRFLNRIACSRKWVAKPKSLEVFDSLNKKPKKAVAYWHFHPNIQVTQLEKNRFSLLLGGGETVTLQVDGGNTVLKKSSWHPGFGVVEKNNMLEVIFDKSDICTRIFWS
ncbi:heparinase II/III family protein [Idiomarina loihiensis]|uniref:heparinase II/III family protein n=1 Tax=Idiomarina loihiensis TaxID=135577 RepID=UPI00384EA6CB